MYSLLPEIYRRYDKLKQDPSTKGKLQRFLEVFGLQLDFIRSHISSGKDLMDINRVDSNLLPLLTQWIGWQTNPALDLYSQRNEIRFAPHFYRTIGVAANLRALVNRMTNWNCQIKEFHHNVCRTNTPPELAIWMQEKTSDGWQPGEPFILDTACDGAPAILRDSDETDWLFYHVHKDKFSDIWYKYTNFEITDQTLRKLRDEGLLDNISIKLNGIINIPCAGKRKFLKVLQDTIGEDHANQYQSVILKNARRWQPAKRLTDGRGLHKYPTAVQTGDGVIHLFWSFRKDGFWHIKTAKYHNNEWKDFTTLFKTKASDIEPAVCSDPNTSDEKWLFWSSRRGARWQIWFSHYHQREWGEPKQLTVGNVNDRKPAAVLVYPDPDIRSIWVFWSRKTDQGWCLFYQIMELKSGELQLSRERQLIELSAEAPFSDCEPYALTDTSFNIYLYWRSNRTGVDNIWYSLCDIRHHPQGWQPAQQITSGADLCQGPAAMHLPHNEVWLWYRSSRSMEYISNVFPNTVTLDHRYAGATTLDTLNLERWHRRDSWEDNQTYIYDTGIADSNWYARDTIGIYLTPDARDEAMARRITKRVQSILPGFLPLHLRAVVILNPPIYNEYFYTYDDKDIKPQRLIQETWSDEIITAFEQFPTIVDSHHDKIATWCWFRTWSEETPDSETVDTQAAQLNLKFRLYFRGIEEGDTCL